MYAVLYYIATVETAQLRAIVRSGIDTLIANILVLHLHCVLLRCCVYLTVRSRCPFGFCGQSDLARHMAEQIGE